MKNVLNYFVRKAFGFKSTATAEDKTLFGHLLRIRQNIQGVYDWLYGRLSAEHLPKRMPMTEAVTSADGHEVRRPVLQNSDNLLAHLRLLDGRKISNGYADGTPADDGLPDGVSLARLLCDSTTQPTELIDDNVGWVCDKNLFAYFPNIKKLVLGAESIKFAVELTSTMMTNNIVEDVEVLAKRIENTITSSYYTVCYHAVFSLDNVKSVHFPTLEYINGCLFRGGVLPEVLELPNLQTATRGIAENVAGVKRIIAPKLESCAGYSYNPNLIAKNPDLEYAYFPNLSSYTVYATEDGAGSLQDMPNLKHLVIGKVAFTNNKKWFTYALDGCPNLIRLEITGELNQSMYLNYWNPTNKGAEFLSNFLHFIAERVAQGNYTLTLSAAVYAALEQQEGQTILALLNTKGWTVVPA